MYWNQLMLGFAHLLSGDIPFGEVNVNQVLEVTRKSGMKYIYYPALVCEAYMNMAKGNLDLARSSLNQVMELCQPCDLHRQIYLGYWMLGLISRKEGDLTNALTFVEKATALAHKIKNPWLEINGLQLSAQIHQVQKAENQSEKQRIRELIRLIQNGGVPAALQEDFDNFLDQIRLD